MPIVLFRQSKQQELETILWTIKEHRLVEKFCNVIIYPKLPRHLWQAIEQDDKTFKNSRGIVKLHLEKTNQLVLQKNASKIVAPLWRKIEKEFFARAVKLTKVKICDKYICYLTRYGGGGSFNPPNTIWVRANIKNKNDLRFFTYTVAHEITHLLLDNLLNKKKRTKRQKEKAVDAVLIKTNLFK
ncbi:MAG: hypothetical protein AAB911_01030 [Patescibacteria group bacterium]